MTPTTENSNTINSLLIYMTLMILLITLIPFRFHMPEKIEFLWSFNLKDFILNVLLFVPIGFLVGHSRKTSNRFYWKAICFGTSLSLSIELAQAFIMGRTTSAYDVIANGSGAFLGAGFYDYAKGKIKEQEPYRVSSLQIPLVNLVLLLTPLLWLARISSGDDPLRLYLLLLPLGIFGSGLLSSIYVNRLAYTAISPNRFIFTATGWFLLSTLPSMVRYPKDVVIIWIVMFVIILIQAVSQKPRSSKNRRFETATLRKLLPVFGVYLLLLIFLPATMGVSSLPEQSQLLTTIRLVEFIAAFAILGYMIAEMRGRKDQSPFPGLCLAFGISSALLVLSALIQGTDPIMGKLIHHGLPLVVASLYGGMMYRLQLAAFKRMKGSYACKENMHQFGNGLSRNRVQIFNPDT
jgi:glycopeptide antibiotics resistance protein